MYGWVWRRLPGGTGAKAVTMVVLALAAIAAGWLWVFPWVYLTFPV